MRVVDVKIWDNYLFHLHWKAYDFGMINFKSPPPLNSELLMDEFCIQGMTLFKCSQCNFKLVLPSSG